MSYDDPYASLREISAGGICEPIIIRGPSSRINVWLSSGATVTVFKSGSPPISIANDLAAGRLTYANFNADTQTGFQSRWTKWAKGPVVYVADPLMEFVTEPPLENMGWTSVLAIATGGAARIEVIS